MVTHTPKLQLVLNDSWTPERLAPLVTAGLDGVRVRVRDDATAMLLAYVRDLVEAFPSIDISVNGRLDIAMALNVPVHLPSTGVPVADAVRIAGTLRVGRSVHSVTEAIAAENDGAHLVSFGHVFASASHPDEPPRGLQHLADVVRAVSVPVIAIGGITPDRVAAVRSTGAAGIAVIGAITQAADPTVAVTQFREEWES